MTPDRAVDPGLQAERTALAWDRTTLGFVVVAALLLRLGTTASLPAAQLFAVLTLAVAGWGLVVSRARYGRRDASLRDDGAPAPGSRSIAAAGALGVAVSLGALATVVTVTVRTL